MPLKPFIKTLKELPDQLYSVTDVSGLVHWASPEFCNFYGYSLDELIDKNLIELLKGKETCKETLETIRFSRKNGIPYDVEMRNYVKSGNSHFTHIKAKPIRDDQHQVIGFISIEQDISRYQHQKEIYEHNTKLLEDMSEMAKVGVWEVDLENMNPIWSKEVYRIHEVDPNTKPDLDTAINFYAPEHRQIVVDSINHALKTGDGWDLELNFITAKKNKLRVRAIGNVDMLNGKPIRLYGTFQDVTAQYQAEQKTRIISERLMHVSKNSKIGIWDWNIIQNELIWNDMMYELYHLNKDHIENNIDSFYAALHPDDAYQVKLKVNRAIKDDQAFDTTFRIIWKDTQRVRHIRALAHVYKNDEGQVIRMLGSNWDITEQKEIETKLEQALQDANAGLLSRNRFLAMMSHEIRTPLNGIIGSLQLLNGENLNEQQNELLMILLNSSDVLLNTINDIIDLSKIESGNFTFHYEPFDFHKFIHEVENFQRPLFVNKSLDFKVTAENGLPQWVNADKNRIQQILNNLFSNALKFTEEGLVSLDIQMINQDEDIAHLRFIVKDTGVGIPSDKVETIFEEFTQVESGFQRKFGGSGLGLSICQFLAKEMNGNITCQSETNQGSSFILETKFKICEAQYEKEQTIEEKTLSEDINILLAEDNLVNQKIIKKILAKLGIENLSIVNNGKEALEASEEKAYDIILMDIQMPEMDGLESMKRIRMNHDNPNAQKPIIAVTANAMAGDRELYMNNGFSETVSKPIDIQALKSALIKLH